MLRVVADTNTLVSAVISKGNEFELLNLAHEGKLEIVLSPQILKEFRNVISRAKFGFSEEQIDNAFKQLINTTTIVVPSIKLDIIKEDTSDNKVLECAEAGNADYIVSGDRHLLKLKEYKNIRIVRTSEVLKIINNTKTQSIFFHNCSLL